MQLAILLATYNSEKFLAEQLDSLYNQTYKDFNLYVRDDGSLDSTFDIIAEYSNKYNNITILNDDVKGRKAAGSFMYLLENVEADYYMFCDHDDVWLERKIESSLNKIKELESANPATAAVVNTDLEVVDIDLNTISESMWGYMKINRELLNDPNYLMLSNCFTGCTMIINSFAKLLTIPMPKDAYMHDAWIALKVARSGGVLGYVNEATIKYRQHGNNVAGVYEADMSFKYKINNLKKIIDGNIEQLKMARATGKLWLIEYFYYKILYFVKRYS